MITRVGVLQFRDAVVQHSVGALDKAFAGVKKLARLFLAQLAHFGFASTSQFVASALIDQGVGLGGGGKNRNAAGHD